MRRLLGVGRSRLCQQAAPVAPPLLERLLQPMVAAVVLRHRPTVTMTAPQQEVRAVPLHPGPLLLLDKAAARLSHSPSPVTMTMTTTPLAVICRSTAAVAVMQGVVAVAG